MRVIRSAKLFNYSWLLAALLLASCAGTPPQNAALKEAQHAFQLAQSNPDVVQLAPLELRKAREALNRAESAWRERESAATIEHQAYLAKQRVAIAREVAEQKEAEAVIQAASAERDRVQLLARAREAEIARQQAQASTAQAQAAQQLAIARAQEAEQARQRAQTAQQQTLSERQRAAQLEAELAELKARQTERGAVLTLGDVLFDTGEATLKPGAQRTIEQLAEFLQKHPDRNVMIEGFTDSVGSDGYNQQLSERRAESVRRALLGYGIDPERVLVRGFGEQFPVASNSTTAGRQLNRRVEIVISNDRGIIPERTNMVGSR